MFSVESEDEYHFYYFKRDIADWLLLKSSQYNCDSFELDFGTLTIKVYIGVLENLFKVVINKENLEAYKLVEHTLLQGGNVELENK